MNKLIKINKESGVSVFLALLILTGILAIALGIVSLVLSEFKTSANLDDSVKAIFAADSGVECKLMEVRSSSSFICNNLTFSNGSDIDFLDAIDNRQCDGDSQQNTKAVKAIGAFNKVKRSLCSEQGV